MPGNSYTPRTCGNCKWWKQTTMAAKPTPRGSCEWPRPVWVQFPDGYGGVTKRWESAIDRPADDCPTWTPVEDTPDA